MTDIQALLASEMAKLRNVYLERIPGELGEISMLAGKLTGHESDHSILENLHHRLHKLAGSGGTFGLPKLGEQSRALELTVKSWMSGEVLADNASLGKFIVTVAELSSSLSAPDTSAAPEVADMILPANIEGRNNLWLVDDDVELGLELQRLLKQFGYDIRLFSRLSDVETAAKTEEPDVLIMDIDFPEEGADSSVEMSVRPTFKAMHCPLLFISAQGSFAARIRAARLGARGFLLKPLEVPKLVDQIERIAESKEIAAYRVLIVDDDETLSAHYRLVLMSAGMDVEILNQPEKIIERASAFHPELILMDMNMPDYSGQELAMVLRQHEKWVGLPIIYLSAESDIDEQIKAMGKGADDFLTKPISDTRLIAAVTVRAARARQMSDLISRDGLTGLIKHSRIKEILEIELARAKRNGSALSTVMVDIDHFKKVNDTYGHPTGDRVIRAIAHLIKQRLRKSDIVGRYGGEEFVVVLPECDANTAHEILNDIRERFASLVFHHEKTEFRCTMSAGVACLLHYPQANSAELLAKADEALYTAKQSGRNQVRIAQLTDN